MDRDYSKVITFLTALEQGHDIILDGYTYALGEDQNGNPRIARRFKVIHSDNSESEKLMEGLDLPDINNFLNYVSNKMTDEDQSVLNANMALTSIIRNRR